MPDPGEPLDKNWLLDINGVACNIYTDADGDDAITEAVGTDGRKAVVRFICRWDNRNDLIAGLVGTVDYQDGSILRTAPFYYPVATRDNIRQNPGKMYNDRWFCTSILDIRGKKWRTDEEGEVTGIAGWGYYAGAIITAEFTSPPYLTESIPTTGNQFNDLLNETYCITKLRVSGEVTAPPTGALGWKEGTFAFRALDDANAGFVRTRYELSCTRMRMPLVPTTTLDKMIGTVNTTTLQVGSNTIGTSAALFMGYNVEPRSDPYNGGIIHDIELLWLVNGFINQRNDDGNWNWFLDPKGDWNGVAFNKGEGQDLFSMAEHHDLLSDQIS